MSRFISERVCQVAGARPILGLDNEPFAPQVHGTLRPPLGGRFRPLAGRPPSERAFLYRSAGISAISGPDAVKGLPTE